MQQTIAIDHQVQLNADNDLSLGAHFWWPTLIKNVRKMPQLGTL